MTESKKGRPRKDGRLMHIKLNPILFGKLAAICLITNKTMTAEIENAIRFYSRQYEGKDGEICGRTATLVEKEASYQARIKEFGPVPRKYEECVYLGCVDQTVRIYIHGEVQLLVGYEVDDAGPSSIIIREVS